MLLRNVIWKLRHPYYSLCGREAISFAMAGVQRATGAALLPGRGLCHKCDVIGLETRVQRTAESQSSGKKLHF